MFQTKINNYLRIHVQNVKQKHIKQIN